MTRHIKSGGAQFAALALTSGLAAVAAGATFASASLRPSDPRLKLYETSHQCTACHNGLSSPKGEDVSIASAWRATMMANSGRDPYWQASVGREVAEHGPARAKIEDECATCHMPMMRSEAHMNGASGTVLARLPLGHSDARGDRLATDGVSCTTCHQITDQNLGKPESFNGGFAVDTTQKWRKRVVYGPYELDSGRTRIMHSSSEFQPAQGKHIRASELCATCHTLFTEALDAGGKTIGRLPEQVPYLEWQQSSYKDQKSCQSCHMPVVTDSMPFSRVWGDQREGLARHEFRGGNFFVLDMLNRYRKELAVEAQPAELMRGVALTMDHLATSTAHLELRGVAVTNGRVTADVIVTNAAGHKFPTAYPSRRAWLHVVVTDATGRKVFESGALRPDASIDGNDNDADATKFEPHYREIHAPTEVQIYESVMVDAAGVPTTALLQAVRYAKDNRLLPSGLDKARATADIAVHGDAEGDVDFNGGVDVVHYAVDAAGGQGPFTVSAELLFQPIGFRWAMNLGAQQSAEAKRFLGYYGAMSASSAATIARSSAQAR